MAEASALESCRNETVGNAPVRARLRVASGFTVGAGPSQTELRLARRPAGAPLLALARTARGRNMRYSAWRKLPGFGDNRNRVPRLLYK